MNQVDYVELKEMVGNLVNGIHTYIFELPIRDTLANLKDNMDKCVFVYVTHG